MVIRSAVWSFQVPWTRQTKYITRNCESSIKLFFKKKKASRKVSERMSGVKQTGKESLHQETTLRGGDGASVDRAASTQEA